MSDLQQVIKEAKSHLDKGYVFIHIKDHWLRTLLDGLEIAQSEVERFKYTAKKIVEQKDKIIKNIASRNTVLSTEHAAMKEALEWIDECGTDYQSIKKAHSVLSTLSPKEE